MFPLARDSGPLLASITGLHDNDLECPDLAAVRRRLGRRINQRSSDGGRRQTIVLEIPGATYSLSPAR